MYNFRCWKKEMFTFNQEISEISLPNVHDYRLPICFPLQFMCLKSKLAFGSSTNWKKMHPVSKSFSINETYYLGCLFILAWKKNSCSDKLKCLPIAFPLFYYSTTTYSISDVSGTNLKPGFWKCCKDIDWMYVCTFYKSKKIYLAFFESPN